MAPPLTIVGARARVRVRVRVRVRIKVRCRIYSSDGVEIGTSIAIGHF